MTDLFYISKVYCLNEQKAALLTYINKRLHRRFLFKNQSSCCLKNENIQTYIYKAFPFSSFYKQKNSCQLFSVLTYIIQNSNSISKKHDVLQRGNTKWACL